MNMESKRKKAARQCALAILSLSVSLGAGMNVAQAANERITVTDPNYKLTHNISYAGTTGANNPSSVMHVSPKASGGKISIDTVDIKGNFTSNTGDTGNGANSNGILIGNGYKGTLELAGSADIQVIGAGNRIHGAGIYSSQDGTNESGSTGTSINLGDSVRIHYTVNSSDATAYGIYNNNGTLKAETGSEYITMDGQIGSTDSDFSHINSSGIYNSGRSTADINNIFLTSDITSKGTVAGDISGIESINTGNSTGSFKLNSASVNVSFMGKGNTDKENPFNIRTLGITNSSFTGGTWSNFLNTLKQNSSAFRISGAEMDHGTASFGEYSNLDVTTESGSVVNGAYGLLLRNQSAINGKDADHFGVNVDIKGQADHVDAIRLLSGSSLTLGKQASITNTIETTDSANEGAMVTAINASDNSHISIDDDAIITMKVLNQNYSTVAGVNLINSQMSTGKRTQIITNGSHTGYDENAQVYGVNVSGTDKNTSDDKSLIINESSFIDAGGTNVGTVVGVSNSSNGTIEIKGADSVMPLIRAFGDGKYTAGIRNTGTGKVILGDSIQMITGGSTNIEDSNIYGIDNINSTIDSGYVSNWIKTTKGYANNIGIHTVGTDNAPGYTSLTSLEFWSSTDKASYGIYNEKNARTVIQSGDFRVSGNVATGIYAIGPKSEVTIGGAYLESNGGEDSYGIHVADGAHTVINGRTLIESTTNNNPTRYYQEGDNPQLGYAVFSEDKGSLVDITGKDTVENIEEDTGGGVKYIIGNLYSKDGGVIRLSMNSAGSVMTGMSLVNRGTTDIDMSNGSHWTMTGNSTVSDFSLNSGAMVDMTRNQDQIYGINNSIDLTGNPDKYQTLHVRNFSGNDGIFKMKTDLASQTDGDKVFIDNAAPGSSGIISVYDASLATGNKVTGAKHLLLVTDPSRHTTFTGKDLDTGGLWEITPTIEQGGTFTDADGNRVGTRDQWYLATLAKKINPDTVPVIKNIDNTYGLYRMSMDTLRQRLGDLRYRNRSEDKYDIWARNRGGRYEGNGYDSKYNFFQVGMDTMPNEKSVYGFLVERGIASPSFTTGSGKNHTLAGALYATWLGDHGSYTDVVAKVGRDDTTLHTYGAYGDSASYREDEQSLSVEYGRTVDLGSKGYFIEPQAQFVMGHLSSNSYTTRRGTQVYEDGYNSAIGRLGFVLGKKHKEGKNPYDFYLKASVLHEFGGDRNYNLSRINAYGDEETLDGSYSYGDTWLEVGFGGNVKLNNSTNFYADVERSFASDFTKKWQVNAGINWSF